MNLKFSKKDYSELTKLILYKDMNIASNEATYQFFFENLSKDHFNEYLNLDLKEEENCLFYNTYFKDGFFLLNNDKFENEDYAKVLKNIKFKDKNYSLNNLILKKHHLIPFDDVIVHDTNYFIEKMNVGYFNKDFSYIALSKDDVVWMSLDPSEIITMNKVKNHFKGDVLIFGLGLGYFPYLIKDNKEVTSITIIEKDINVIEIYKNQILPHLNYQIPINIIHEDAYIYINNNDISKYDSIYVDIWHNANDGLPLYHRFLKSLKLHKNVHYWLEVSMLCLFRRIIISVIQEELEGLKDKDFLKVENEIDEYFKLVHFKFKNKIFNDYLSLKEFLKEDNLKKILIDL